MKGWTDKDLPIIVDQVSHWTLAEASYVLGVPLTRMRAHVKASALTPCGRRPHATKGRAPRVYQGSALVRIAEEMSLPMYDGVTPTKFGQYAVAEPFRADRMHLFKGEALKEVDHESPIPVLDQEDLEAQGIDTSVLVPGAQRVDALGSCTANATTCSLGERWQAVHGTLPPGLSSANAVADEEYAICFYHACTYQTGQPSQEWPPTDCGSTGLYCCTELEHQKLISGYKSASGIHDVASLLQTGTVIVGGPWFNSWMEPDSKGFVDGDGSMLDLEHAVSSGVAGGHETCITALEQITFNGLGLIDPDNSHVRVRNSWSTSWGDNGSYRIHLSTYQLLGRYFDFKQFTLQEAE